MDPQAMEHPQIDDDAVAERYLLGQLSEADKERFEAHYLGCPACLDQLELAEAMVAGAREAAAKDGLAAFGIEAEATVEATAKTAPLAPVSPFPTTPLPTGPLFEGPLATAAVPAARRRLPFRKRHAFALAAILVLAIALPFYMNRNYYGEPAAVLDLERGDGAEAATRLEAPKEGKLVLAAQLSPPIAENYAAKLYRMGGSKPAWIQEGLDPRGELLHMAIPAAALEPGEYLLRLQLYEHDGESDVGYYRFAIKPAAP